MHIQLSTMIHRYTRANKSVWSWLYVYSYRAIIYILIQSKMAKKCTNCSEKEEIKNVEARKEKKFSFPTLWITVVAKNLEEAEKKVKAMTEYEDKSI